MSRVPQHNRPYAMPKKLQSAPWYRDSSGTPFLRPHAVHYVGKPGIFVGDEETAQKIERQNLSLTGSAADGPLA